LYGKGVAAVERGRKSWVGVGACEEVDNGGGKAERK